MVTKNGSYFSSTQNTKSYKKLIKIDAKNRSIGRIASQVAKLLLGKEDYFLNSSSSQRIEVIIENSNYAILTGKKADMINYRRHSGRPGGLKILSYKQVKEKNPKRIFERAVKGMLPKNHTGRKLFLNLKITFK